VPAVNPASAISVPIANASVSSSTAATNPLSTSPLLASATTATAAAASPSLPFDDSGLAPPGLAATCALPNLPVFNVKSYGATGNGVTDDTVAIRNALAAAEAAGGGIIYLPTGTYAVCPQASDPSPYGAIFTITSSNIVFIGDGAGETHLDGYCLGLKNPVTNWIVTGQSYVQIGRFAMFDIDSSTSVPISTVQFRSLDIDGDAGYTGDSQVGGDPATGDGWDMTHKGIELTGSGTFNNVLVFNCNVDNWRGEEIYAGGDNNGRLSIINCHLYSSNADAVSASANVYMNNDVIGGTTAGSDVYNGVEDFAMGAPEGTAIINSTISCSSNPANLHGNGVVFSGLATSDLVVEGTTLSNNTYGILFSEVGSNVTVQNNTFSNNANGMITSIEGLDPGEPTGFANFTISGNTFNNSGIGFLPQAYGTGYATFPNLVLQGNTVINGSLIGGAFYSPTPGAWTGFVVADNTLGVGGTDISQFNGGNNFALWSDTIRTNPATPAPFMSSGAWVNDFSSETTTPFTPTNDMVVLNSNQNSGTQYLTLGVPVAAYPVGFQTEVISAGDKNWAIAANPTWNNFSSNVPIGPNGVWIGVNSQGLFTLLPVVSGVGSTSLAYTAGAPAVAITSSLSLSDPNSTTLAGATVRISSNYQNGADLLSFTNTSKITGSWNAATGTLTLSGTDTLADYQAALQSVRYVDVGSSTSTTTRLVTFQVNDGIVASNIVSRQITVAPGGSSTAVLSLGSVAALSNNATPTFAGTAAVQTATVTVSIYSGSSVSGTPIEVLTATPNATTGAYSVLASPALATGTYTAQASQANPAGSTYLSTTTTFMVDTAAPTTSGLAVSPSPTNHAPSITATVSDTAGVNVMAADYFIDTVGANGTGTALTGTFGSATVNVSGTLTAATFTALSQGTHTIYVQGEDAAGNWGTCVAATFVKDTVAPSITLNAVASSNTGTPTFTGTGGVAAGDSSTITIPIYSGSTASGTPVETLTATCNASSGAYSVSASPALPAGTYTAMASQTDSAGNRGSALATFTVSPATPSAPSKLTATATYSKAVTLSWVDNSTNQTGVSIERTSNGGTTWSVIAQVGAAVTRYTDTTVNKGTIYEYRVYAFNGSGNSAFSNVVTITVSRGSSSAMATLAPTIMNVSSQPLNSSSVVAAMSPQVSSPVVSVTEGPAPIEAVQNVSPTTASSASSIAAAYDIALRQLETEIATGLDVTWL
jgi:hypothetical protein